MRGNRRLVLVALPAVILAVTLIVVFASVQRTLNLVSHHVEQRGQLSFSRRPLDSAVALAAGSGFQPVNGTPSFTQGVTLNGDLYLGGSGGLAIYSAGGKSLANLRTGLELPAAPIIAMAAGRPRGAPEAQLLLATEGAGLLVLTPSAGARPGLEQVLPDSPEARDLTAVLPLPGGDVLLGTRYGGVLVFNGTTLVPLRFSAPVTDAAHLQVTALSSPAAAALLIGTRTDGLIYLHAGLAERADSASGMPDDQVLSLAVSGSRAYAGTPLGTAEFNLGDGHFHPQRTLAPGTFSNALFLSAQQPAGQLLVGTLERGVQQVSLDAGRDGAHLVRSSITAPRDEPAQSPLMRVDAFLGAPGLVLADGRLMRKVGGSWTPALPPDAAALTDRNISALAFTPDGSLYVGFFDHGLDIVRPDEGSRPRHLESDSLFCINRLVPDPQSGLMAAATANGLVLFSAEGTPRQVLTRRDGLISDHVSDIAYTPAGMALATPAGITWLTPAGAESLYAFEGLVNNHVYTLATNGPAGGLLAGTLGGISVLQAQQVKRNFTATNSALAHNWITAILHVPQGDLLGTYGAGLEWMKPDGSFEPVDLPAGTPHNIVINPNALLETSTHIFAGTLADGLLVYSKQGGRWTRVTQGLPSANVTSFAARGGEVYIGTDNGLMRIAEAQLP